MADLKDHAQKIERIVQALTAEGIGRDVAVSTALMRYPPTRTLGVERELAAIHTKDDGLRPAIHTYAQAPALDPAYLGPVAVAYDPIPELADCEPVEIVLSKLDERGGLQPALMLRAVQRAGDPSRLMFRGALSPRQAEAGLKLLAGQKPLVLTVEHLTRYGLLWAFKLEQQLDGAYFTADFHIAKDTAPMSDHERAQFDTCRSVIRDWERLAARAAVVMETALGLKHGDHHSILDLAENMAANFKLSLDARAALFGALGQEDSALTTPELVAALAGERDTLIDREVQMRAACIDAIGPVSSGSTLDLVRKLAGELKVARAEIADYARLREHNLQLQALVSKVRAAVS